METIRSRAAAHLQAPRALAPVRTIFAAPLLQGKRQPEGPATGAGVRAQVPSEGALEAPGTLLTVKEAAALLRVSTATIYKLVGEGKVAHVRVGNVIRIRG